METKKTYLVQHKDGRHLSYSRWRGDRLVAWDFSSTDSPVVLSGGRAIAAEFSLRLNKVPAHAIDNQEGR